MRKIFLILTALLFASVLATVSCEKLPESQLSKKTSVSEVLSAISDVYKVSTYKQTSDEYVIYFDNPVPVTIKGQKDVVLKELKIPADQVKTFEDKGDGVHILLSDGKSFLIRYRVYLTVEVDRQELSFRNESLTGSIHYEVTNNSSGSYDVKLSSLNNFDVAVSRDGNKGELKFTAKEAGNYSQLVNIVFSNEGKEVIVPVMLSVIDDSVRVQTSYEFPEYARIFTVEVPDHVNVLPTVSDDCKDWITVKVGQSLDGAKTRNSLFFLLDENKETLKRIGTVTLIKELTDGSSTDTEQVAVRIVQAGLETEGSFKKGLLDFYEALDGDNWFKRADDTDARQLHWNKDMSVIDFYGLQPSHTMDASLVDPQKKGKVYFGDKDLWAFNMPFNGLKGTIPESFWDICKYFTSITINNCYLQESTLSDKVWHENLEGINLWHTYINGTLPPAIANAKNLKELIFSKCRLTGELPNEITSLKKLTYVDLDDCDISGSLPINIGDLTQLERFRIEGNLNFGGTLPDSFYNLTNLKSFIAGDTQLGGILSTRIGEMKALRSLGIECCEFEGKIPEEAGITRILDIGANGNYFTEIPEYVRYMGAYNNHNWFFGGDCFASGVSYLQRKKETGRPDDYIIIYPQRQIDKMSEDYCENYPYTWHDNITKYTYILPMPTWAHVRYKTDSWNEVIDDSIIDGMIWPYAEDLQYPANEYYYDKQKDAWCHPKLEYPAREYYKNERGEWIHDASCPWEKIWVPEN